MQQTRELPPLSTTTSWAATEGSTTLLSYAGAFLIGVALLAATFPLGFLLGTVHLAYPPEADTAQHIVAQRYFLADAWRWPLFQIMNLFIPNGVNLAFVDGIPLLAVPLKLLSPLLPPAFHGIGLWYAICWLLQPVAAVWCLRGAGERRLLPALAVAVAAVSMPAWWDRFGHAALCGHFFLLVALGLYLRLVRRPEPRRWGMAIAFQLAALLVHPYLALMVLAILSAVPLTLLARRRDGGWRRAALGAGGCVLVLIGAMALLGYLGATGGQGFGIYAMDILSPFWPARSALAPVELTRLDASGGPGSEGYNYLGAGLIAGLVAVAVLRHGALRQMLRRHAGLALVLLALAVLSISQRPAIGGQVLFDLGRVPDWLEHLRSTGRFFWPVAYAALVGAVLLAARHPRPLIGAALVVGIAALQFADATTLRANLREHLRSPAAGWLVDEAKLRPMLAAAESLTLLPSWHCVPGADPRPEQRLLMNQLALASEVGVPVSTMYVARWKGELRCHDQRLASAPLGKGELRLLSPSAQAAYLPLIPRGDALCSPVGQLVACRDPAATEVLPPTHVDPPPAPRLTEGEIGFAALDLGTGHLGSGWSQPETEGTWSLGDKAVLEAERPAELAGPLALSFELQGLAPAEGQPQEVTLRWHGAPIARWALADRQRTWVTAVLPPAPSGPMTLEFDIAEPTRPAERDLNTDTRRLGVMLHRLRVAKAPAWPELTVGEVAFGEGAPGTTFLGHGWSQPEAAAVWSDGEAATLQFTRPAQLLEPTRLIFEVQGFGPSSEAPQTVEVWDRDRHLATWQLPDGPMVSEMLVLPRATHPEPMSLQFRVAEPTRPDERGSGADRRRLGVRLWRLDVVPGAPAAELRPGRYGFAAEGTGLAFLGTGWQATDPTGVALAGDRASLRFARPEPLTGPFTLVLEWRREPASHAGPLPIELRMWGHHLASWNLGTAGTDRVEALIPAGGPEETELELRLAHGTRESVRLVGACIEPVRYRHRDTGCEPRARSATGPSATILTEASR